MRLLHCGGQVGTVVGIGDLEAQPADEVVEHFLVDVGDRVAQDLTDVVPELVVGARRVPARADYRVLLG